MLKPSVHKALQPILLGVDLKRDALNWCSFPHFAFCWGLSNECRQSTVCTNHGFCTVDERFPHSRSTRRQCRSAPIDMCRTISGTGLLAIDLARKPARYRSYLGSQRQQTLCNGFASPRASLHLGGRKRMAGLAHLVGCRRLARFAWSDSGLYSHQRRQNARRQRVGYLDGGGRGGST